MSFSFDLSAFLSQNNAFYTGFVLGVILGSLVAYLFFRTSLRFYRNLCKSQLETMKFQDEKIKILNEHYKNALIGILSQQKADNDNAKNKGDDKAL